MDDPNEPSYSCPSRSCRGRFGRHWATGPLAYFWPVTIIVGVGIAIVVLTVLEATLNYQELAAKYTIISEDCQTILTEWVFLWLDIETDSVEEEEARRRQRELLTRTNVVFSRVVPGEDKKLNDRTWEEAKEMMDGRYVQTA